ncbi:hypothetical protein COV81_00945 [Candidatus Peregrinibacteria bacterium CG11_big_fil_rev_8_21_14_0_20_41_10]|nr:MAG: hypothetical protein COV81_00945 [Candidatus Peregrinibacteria bacterium CG11_big_fil_rev_8_21_14_0_20_41_10]PJC38112.1 MAG: hypothetical protein CO045_01880 [Candidatus Peregrinibacteria bacterium CG_4_9_14_0_2_um_filter_41_14]
MSKQAKGFSLADTEEMQAFNLDATPQPDAKAEIEKLADEEQVIHLDIDDIDLVKIQSEVKKIDKASAKGKAKYGAAYKDLHKAFSFGHHVPIREKQTFYELTSVMIEAGIPILKTIKVYADQTTHKYFQKVCRAISWQIENGEKFSDALAEYPKIFDEAERGTIAAAEATGRLVEAFRRLAIEVQKSSLLRSKVRGALIYPVTVMAFVVVTVFILMRYVVPQISQLFLQANLELPAITRAVVGTSEFFVQYGVLVLVGIVAVIITNYLLYRVENIRYYYHLIELKIPIFNTFLKDYTQAAFARSLANLISSGVGIVQSLEITAKSVNNLVYRRKIELLAKDVTNGISMGDSLANSPYFSNMLVHMITVGEQTAQIDNIALKLANYYTEKVYDTADNFAKLLQPLIIGVVGGIVGVIVLAIMLPMSDILGSIESL